MRTWGAPRTRSPAASPPSASRPAIASRSSPARAPSGRWPTSAPSGPAPPWCPSTTRTPPRSASTCSRTPARASSSARTRHRRPRSPRPRDLPRPRARVVLDGAAPGAITLDALRERGRALDEPVARRAHRRRRRPTTWRRSSTPRARPGRPRAACSRTRTCWPRSTAARRPARAGPAPMIFLFLPLAHVLARVIAVRRAGRRRDARLLERRPASSSSTTSPRRAPTHFPSVPRVLEKIHTRVLGDGEEPAARKRRDLRAGAGASGRGAHGQARAASAGAARAPAPRRSPTGWCSRKVRERLRRQPELALTGAAPIGARGASSSSTPAACPCSRATG